MIAIPKEVIDEAKSFARETMNQALDGAFGLIEKALDRRQSKEFAVEKALKHKRLSERLHLVPGLVGLRWRTRRHYRLFVRWEAIAFARGAGDFARACGLKCRATDP